MDIEHLKKLLRDVEAGRVNVDDAIEKLKHLPFEDLGFATVDHHRSLRQGFPEVVFGSGKTPEQILGYRQETARTQLKCAHNARRRSGI